MKKLTLAAATLMALTGACPGSMASVRIPQAPPVQSPDCTLWVKSTPSLFAQASEAYASPLRLANRAPQRFEIPFHDEFDDGDATRANYTVVDVDNDGYGDGNSVKNRWFWKEDETLIQFCTDNEAPGNDWLFTPPIHLDGLNIYQLEIIVNMGAASNLRVTVGTSTDPADHREILDLKGIDENWMTSYKADFPVPEEGDYYIGLYNYSGSDSFYFNLFSIDIKAGISSQIPMAPSDLTVTPAAEGALEASLKFTAPATLANGSPITGQTDITVLRNGTVADTFKAEPGAETSWTDKTPDQGENKYTVFATHNGKEGMTAEVTAWVGTDIPGAITLTDIHTT
ncbi:MAG: hypothetical protein K2F63_04840, partial [Muribaculaceae bacterium]|nr:hypothetical protein [Muribaculaceae bacterium]